MYEKLDDYACVRDMLPVNALARTFGRNVSLFRCAQGLPKRVLAEMAGISRPYLNDIERGAADVRLSTVMRIAEALAVNPLVLLYDLGSRDRGGAHNDR